ncbi:MAG: gamma-glutamyltranspeptidase / glutathione hydrolase [Gaiellaceae bacterium]|jgi:gamma-glutamyltranspeptidase/glutathione hydrolase|nr:gamma-glutamyltranspeptidase / glutathione hydrolase [Gaiellaceae bacterium]
MRRNQAPAGVAAGHPETARAGLEVLAAGGSAVDAAVAACLASCVAETVMTGLLGGGFALVFDAARGEASVLDFFVAVPGLGAEARARELIQLEVPFGEELVHYAIGPASCAVPGVAAGLRELSRRHGRAPWDTLVEPALALARAGVAMPEAHAACLAMLEPVMTYTAAGAALYAPGGKLLRTGDVLRQPGLVAALQLEPAELDEALLALSDERGGALTREDLARYEPVWREPAALDYCGTQLVSRAGLAPIGPVLAGLPRLAGLPPAERVSALVRALASDGPETHTTNLVAVDADGNGCAITTSLGLGSGDFLPGLDLHLNSMLGETDLLRGPLEPGERMQSMMAPSAALQDGRLVLAGGAAGGTRLPTALVTVLAGILDEGLGAQEAVDRPRVHPAGALLHAEPGVDEGGLAALEREGFAVRRWPVRHHYFGGVSVVSTAGAAGDPRRSGLALALR